MDNQQLQQLILQYKIASQAAEQANAIREKAKEDFLKFVDNKEGQYCDITVAFINPEPTFDWKALLKEYAFEARKVAKFYKEKASYLRITIKRGIVLS